MTTSQRARLVIALGILNLALATFALAVGAFGLPLGPASPAPGRTNDTTAVGPSPSAVGPSTSGTAPSPTAAVATPRAPGSASPPPPSAPGATPGQPSPAPVTPAPSASPTGNVAGASATPTTRPTRTSGATLPPSDTEPVDDAGGSESNGAAETMVVILPLIAGAAGWTALRRRGVPARRSRPLS